MLEYYVYKKWYEGPFNTVNDALTHMREYYDQVAGNYKIPSTLPPMVIFALCPHTQKLVELRDCCGAIIDGVWLWYRKNQSIHQLIAQIK